MKSDSPGRACQRANPSPSAQKPEALDGIDKAKKEGKDKNTNEDQDGLQY
jgi:hypothetical protein